MPKLNKFKLPKEVYYETIWYIRQYPKFKEEYLELMQGSMMWGSPKLDGLPHGSSGDDKVIIAAERLSEVSKKMIPIKKAFDRIPEEYHDGILDNIINRKPYPITADLNTWKKWKQRFVFFVAQERRNQ